MDRNIFLIDFEQKSINDHVKRIIEINEYDNEQDNIFKNYKKQPIKIFISSFGGGVYPTISLIDIMAISKTPINTYSLGYTMSAGTITFLMGNERFITKNSTIMVHQLSYGTNSIFIQSQQEQLTQNKIMQKIVDNLFTTKTKLTQKDLDEIYGSKTNKFYSAKEAIKLKIATKYFTY